MTNCQPRLAQKGEKEEEQKGKSTCKQFGYLKKCQIKKKKRKKEKILQLSYNGIYRKMDIIYFGFICPGP